PPRSRRRSPPRYLARPDPARLTPRQSGTSSASGAGAWFVRGGQVASTVGILDDAQVLDVIKRRRVGRLSCAADGFKRVSAVHYDGMHVPDLYLQAPDPQCVALLRANPRVRLEVDDVQGPSQ